MVGKAFVRAVEQEVRASQQAAKQIRNAKAAQSKITSPTDAVAGISIQVNNISPSYSIQMTTNFLNCSIRP